MLFDFIDILKDGLKGYYLFLYDGVYSFANYLYDIPFNSNHLIRCFI